MYMYYTELQVALPPVMYIVHATVRERGRTKVEAIVGLEQHTFVPRSLGAHATPLNLPLGYTQ